MPDSTPTPVVPAPAPAPVQPTPAATTPAKPDALMIPETLKRGATQLDRIDSICSFAESILGGDRSKGVTARIRRQPGGRKMFVTLSPRDTLRFPVNSGESGPRYYWVAQPDGVEYGYLVDAARKEKASA